MSAGDQVHPEADAWVAAIHATQEDYEPLGSGIVLDDRRILTCAHVIPDTTGPLWVAFPKAQDGAPEERRQVEQVIHPAAGTPVKDLAILVLAEPVPNGVAPAPLRCPDPKSLVGKRWWAFGFPPGDPVGSEADGQVGSALAYGWVRLDTVSRYPVQRGFSGGGLWSPDYAAVVAIVSHANAAQGDGRAITLHQADQCFPDQKLRILAERSRATDAGPLALAAWGWSLAGDSEATRHWRPRARGVSIDSERGYRFRGRTAALQAIVSWLDRDAIDRRVLVVTGAPGAGKSAVLGRVVTTADADAVRDLPESDAAIRATVGSVACAVHSKGKTALEVATQIAKAASAALPERLEDFAPALRTALAERAGSRFNVIIDALDESATPAEARQVVSKVILALAETCADVGAQVIVGSRRNDANGDLLGTFGSAAKLIDLDAREFFAEEDLAAYAHVTLQLAGDEREGNPYADYRIAALVAARIAALSDSNFLVAGLTARTHGLYDEVAVDPVTLTFSPKVDDAMREYLKRIPDIQDASGRSVSAETLLTALAYAESPGLPVRLWRVAAKALDSSDVGETALKRFARSSAASFLVESVGSDGGDVEFRLFHQALNDALLNARAKVIGEREDHQVLTRAFLEAGKEAGWDHAPAYLLRSLPGHAARAELIDNLLADSDYLLQADLLRVQPLAAKASTSLGQQRGRLLRLSPREVITADAPNRAAMFSITEALEGLPDTYGRTPRNVPYLAAWAAAPPSAEHSILRGHKDWVNAVCAFTLHGTTHLATASADCTVRIWDPATAAELRTLTGHDGPVWSVCALTLEDSACLATAGRDAIVRIWDTATGTHLRDLTGHCEAINAVCALTIRSSTYLATAGDDHTVRIWDPTSGSQRRTLKHDSEVHAICAFTINTDTYLAAASRDRTVRIWDPSTGTQLRDLTGRTGRIWAICPLTIDGTTYLATASDDRAIRIWNPATGTQLPTLAGRTGRINAICALTIDGTAYVATAGNHATVRIWNPVTGTQLPALAGHHGRIWSICTLTIGGTPHLATGSDDRTVRIWNPVTATQPHDTSTGHDGPVNAACAFTTDGTAHLATASDDRTIRIWNPTTGAHVRTLTGHRSRVNAVCAFTIDGTTHLATVGNDRTVRIWNAATGTHLRSVTNSADRVNAACAFTIDGATHVATACSDRTVVIWNPATGTHVRSLTGHDGGVNALCAFTIDGTTHLATGSADSTVRIWNPATGAYVRSLTGHDGAVYAVCAFSMDGTTHLATVGNDRTVRLWDPAIGTHVGTLTGHDGRIWSICALTIDGTPHLATACSDRTVRIWDPVRNRALVVPTRNEALSVAYADRLLFVGTTTGVLVIKLNPGSLSRSAR